MCSIATTTVCSTQANGLVRQIDAKGDGRVSKAEFLAAHDKLFDMMNARHGEAVDAKQWLTNHFPH